MQDLLHPSLTTILIVASFPWAVFLLGLLVNGGPEGKPDWHSIALIFAFTFSLPFLIGLGWPGAWPAFLLLWALINVPIAAMLLLLPEKIWTNAKKARREEQTKD